MDVSALHFCFLRALDCAVIWWKILGFNQNPFCMIFDCIIQEQCFKLCCLYIKVFKVVLVAASFHSFPNFFFLCLIIGWVWTSKVHCFSIKNSSRWWWDLSSSYWRQEQEGDCLWTRDRVESLLPKVSSSLFLGSHNVHSFNCFPQGGSFEKIRRWSSRYEGEA